MDALDIQALIDDETVFMIDIDGVIINTEQRIAKIAAEIGWKKVLQTIDWEKHIFSSEQVNGSIDILKEVQTHLKRIHLLTQNNNEIEETAKIHFLRKKGILIPIISVPPTLKKSDIVPPSFYHGNVVLVDDRLKNVMEWQEAGGKSILFCEEEREEDFPKIKSLDFLRKLK